MPFFGVLLFAIVISLLVGSGRSVASDDNPWRMDDPDQGKKSDFVLKNKDGYGLSIQAERALKPGDRRGPGETIVQKTRPGSTRSHAAGIGAQGRSWRTAPGKGSRDEVFGYAGPQPKDDVQSVEASRIRMSPRTNNGSAGARAPGVKTPLQGKFEYGGKVYGAFPSLDDTLGEARRRQRPSGSHTAQNGYLRNGRQRAFRNVLPPPVPAPLPERRYDTPYPGTGLPLGVPPFPGGMMGPIFPYPVYPGYAMPGYRW